MIRIEVVMRDLIKTWLASLAVAMLLRCFIVVAERASFHVLSLTLPGVYPRDPDPG